MSAPTKADPVLVDRIAAALQRHYHGGMYGTWGALGHDDVASACNACWIAAEIAARAVQP